MNSTKKLSNGTILGYSFGGLADAASYNFYIMYMLYFLTAIVGLSAAKAGIIMSIATVVSSISVLVIGPLSDATKSKMGRRRPYLYAGAIILMIGLICAFRPLSSAGGGAFAYYTIFASLIFIGYGTFLGPYNAMGAELTDDYDERTKLRTPAAVLNCVGNIIGISLPLTAVGVFCSRGQSEGSAWSNFAIILAAICALAIFITAVTTKGRDMTSEQLPQGNRINPVKDYINVIKLKPFKWIILICLVFGIGYMTFQSGLIYYVLFCAGLTEAQMSSAMFVNIFVSIVITVLISVLANKINKNKAMAVCWFVSALGMIMMYFVGVKSFGMLLVLLAIFGIGNGAFWLLIYPIVYDMAEVYEFKHGNRVEGTILSLYSFINAMSVSVGTQVLTRLMTAVGYDPTVPVQTAETVSGIGIIVIWVPVTAFVIGGILCLIYPVSKKAFGVLMEKLEEKRKGNEVDNAGIERLV